MSRQKNFPKEIQVVMLPSGAMIILSEIVELKEFNGLTMRPALYQLVNPETINKKPHKPRKSLMTSADIPPEPDNAPSEATDALSAITEGSVNPQDNTYVPPPNLSKKRQRLTKAEMEKAKTETKRQKLIDLVRPKWKCTQTFCGWKGDAPPKNTHTRKLFCPNCKGDIEENK